MSRETTFKCDGCGAELSEEQIGSLPRLAVVLPTFSASCSWDNCADCIEAAAAAFPPFRRLLEEERARFAGGKR